MKGSDIRFQIRIFDVHLAGSTGDMIQAVLVDGYIVDDNVARWVALENAIKLSIRFLGHVHGR
jgi:hypothetical protein